MSRQLSLSNFLGAKKIKSSVTSRVGRHECRYCVKTFATPQGLASHENSHRAKNDRLRTKKAKYGKVKLRDVPPPMNNGHDSDDDDEDYDSDDDDYDSDDYDSDDDDYDSDEGDKMSGTDADSGEELSQFFDNTEEGGKEDNRGERGGRCSETDRG